LLHFVKLRLQFIAAWTKKPIRNISPRFSAGSRMLEQRIDNKRFLRLIRKWLKAGILEKDGKVLHPITGTPQGGIVSPVLANIYLHYALDLWFETVVKKQCKGAANLWRYADDFVAAFEYCDDAERFYRELPIRLAKFKLTLSMEIVAFSRFPESQGKSFDFLGFEFRWVDPAKSGTKARRSSSFRRPARNSAVRCRTSRNGVGRAAAHRYGSCWRI
jgi:hypothetical protein